MPVRVARRDQCFKARADRLSDHSRAPAQVLAALLIVLLLVMPAGCQRRAPSSQALLQATGPGGALQEVAAPPGVQQLGAALEEHDPQLSILEPHDGALLADGPWQLRLRLRDWPLSDAGPLGIGPHVVVQLDDDPPRRLTAAETGTGSAGTSELTLTMPPLSPGSHRLTAFAARPWGEAVKSPAAHQQVQLLRVAATPLRVPAAGTPQLIPVSPGPEPSAEPVLLDWLLLDAPLQGLREGDASWRLRVTVNGDSFLVDQNAPLWLRGWRQGSNILQLDLVDGRGEPLNPPFNSLLTEVVIDGGAPRPAWLQGRLDAPSLDRLLGRTAIAVTTAMPRSDAPAPTTSPRADGDTAPNPDTNLKTETETGTGTGTGTEADPLDGTLAKAAAEPTPGPWPQTQSEPDLKPKLDVELQPEPDLDLDLEPALELKPEPISDLQAEEPLGPDPLPFQAPTAKPEPEPAAELAETPRHDADQNGQVGQAERQRQPGASEQPIRPSSSLGGPAREQVREDGSLIQPRRSAPLAGLRERLNR